MTDSKNCGCSDITVDNCYVTNCKYNTIDCKCSASNIKVKNENAATKGETYCSTFCQRGSC